MQVPHAPALNCLGMEEKPVRADEIDVLHVQPGSY